eukprot:CAMPEP_0206529064 /NCGR_PEP_ID=MMETSP0325_2-20121206/2371_1 /ASSEMBLY_ACC=CAM_ASM_000347 /TAXON_ID=2866 /ORGANISM="Crypthecodinium cohnii, Strain Seligo" /LENGTH=577 /DNA_ID=CAMNT_0054024893 /DNA_START=109 /DNA_END=1842 /DNA_ORIENTATION=+
MWARRIGCPPLWPSRIKVLIMSWLLVCMYTFFDFLRNADVGYVDLHYSQAGEVACGVAQDRCVAEANPLNCILKYNEPVFSGVQLDGAFSGGRCPSLPEEPQSCQQAALPIVSIQTDLDRIHTINRWFNPIKAWAWLFLCLMAILATAIAVHDLALLEARCRPKILSLRSMKQETPRLWRAIWLLHCGPPMRLLKRKSCVLWALLLPVWAFTQVGIFLTLVYPISLFAGVFWWCPLGAIRLSRVMVFQTGILVFFWSLIFVLVNALSPVLSSVDVYAVFWNAPSFGTGCICYCEYPLRAGIVRNLMFFGTVVTAWAGSLTFRAVKGLRRPNWANLFSILYTVPIEAFPVEWERPAEAGGGPIFLRTDKTVQSEPGFDPFCLMDEQPESGRSTVRFAPVPQTDLQVFRWSKSRDPTTDARIGCCGFPHKQLAKTSEETGEEVPRHVDSHAHLASLGLPLDAVEGPDDGQEPIAWWDTQHDAGGATAPPSSSSSPSSRPKARSIGSAQPRDDFLLEVGSPQENKSRKASNPKPVAGCGGWVSGLIGPTFFFWPGCGSKSHRGVARSASPEARPDIDGFE